jgi:hypothetical protein
LYSSCVPCINLIHFTGSQGSVFDAIGDFENVSVANEVREVGELLAATELRAAKRYWHVKRNDPKQRVYPMVYEPLVIGILWNTMVQFGTWFGDAPYLVYGIQLLPLTPISEERDDFEWLAEIYTPYSQACDRDTACIETGWSIMVLAALATIGHKDTAFEKALSIPQDVYETAGGNGHSTSNTLWYIATRPKVSNPIPLEDDSGSGGPVPTFRLTDCAAPDSCTDEVLDREAGEYSCRDRMNWLIESKGKSQLGACEQVGGVEFPEVCGPCNPTTSDGEAAEDQVQISVCPPCSKEECASDLNQCPMYDHTYVCTGGASYGGCSSEPWDVGGNPCNSCCEITNC